MNVFKKGFLNKALSLLVVLSFMLTMLCSVLTVSAADKGAWAPNTAYNVGDTVSYDGSGYTCILAHTSLNGWEPPNVPALWDAGGVVISTVATPAFNPAGGTYSAAQNVAITCTTSGAAIRYTTDGSEPTSSSAEYTGTITVSATTTIKAKAFKSGMNDSSTATAAYTIDSSRVATPVLSPAGGNYSSAQNVTIACATSGVDIRYTTDGSEPIASSTQYTGAIPVTSGTVTIKARAFKSGMTDSATSSATYTISTTSSTELPAHLLTGYWHNFDNNSKLLRIRDVPTTYDIIAVAFAEATATPGAVSFALDPVLTSQLGYTEQNFISDIAAAKARGQKVVISVGGERGFVSVADATAAANFADSVYSLMNKYGFDGVDIDLENGINATYMASALRQLSAKVGSSLIITMAPQTIDMQNTGMGYFQLALNIKDILTICNMQYYNSGPMLGYDSKLYSQGTVDFLTALATIQLENGLRPDQVGLGLPATSLAGRGYVQPSVVNAALDCFATGAAAGNYKPPRTYPTIRGAMTWSINWDATNGYNFANTVAPKLDSLPNNGTSQVAAPTFNPAGGTYAAAQNVTISCATSGATIRYTTDGTEPTESSTQYIAAIPVSSGTVTIKAKAFKLDLNASATASAAYTITSSGGNDTGTPTGAPPAASLSHDNWDGDGNYKLTMNIWWGNNATSWTIYENDREIFSGPFQGNSPNGQTATCDITGRAKGTYTYKADLKNKFGTTTSNSITVSVTSGSTVETVAAPTFNPEGSTYATAQNVTVSCATSGATIRYTTDGTEPTTSSTQYTAAIAVSSGTVTIKAKAFKQGLNDSATATATYTISPSDTVAAPTFSPAGGSYSSAQNVTLSCTTPNVTIRYTTDGSEPTSASTVYSNAITVATTTTIKAKAFKSGMVDSATVSAAYTISSEPSQGLPKHIMIGYWHTWGSNNPFIKLRDVDPNWDVINIAFTEPVAAGSGDGRMKFEVSGLSTVSGYTINDFKADIKMWQSKGKKVVLSIGGYEGWFYLGSQDAVNQFVKDIKGFINEYGFDGIDVDLEQDSIMFNQGKDPYYKNPTSPRIVNMISALRQICDSYGNDFILSWAPETFYLQNGIQYYAGIHEYCLPKAGCYIPLIHALRDKTTYVHAQLYNSSPMMGNDGNYYNMGTVEGTVAMCEMLLKGFKIMGKEGSDYFFEPLRPDQVVIGVPASTGAAGSGYISNEGLQQAFGTLVNKYPTLRGIMSWSINWDAYQNNNSFVKSNAAYLKSLSQ